MIDLSRIRIQLAARTLFDDLGFRVNDHDRVALVGPNGSGKTTLLRVMAGLLEPDSGQVSRTKRSTIGYLPQEGISHRDRSIIAEARSAFDEILALKREADAIEARMETGEAEEQDIARYADLLDEFHRHGGYEIDVRTAQVLDGLGFQREDWEKDAGTLSGGWQMRLALAKLLIKSPDTLLLDEPTNHLDLIASNWLESYLKDYHGAFVLVSHDRHFLDNIVTHVAELSLGKVRVFTGNYTRYLDQSEKEYEVLEERKRRQDEQIEKMEKFIGKFRYQATKARQVQSRLKELEKVERIELPRAQAEVHFRFPEPPRSGRRVLELEHVKKAYDEKVVFKDLDLFVERGDRLALVGPNGAGKSTLMRILAGRETMQGERKLGHNVSLAYFSQDEGAQLDTSKTVVESVTEVAPLQVIPYVRTLLGSFLFRGDDVFKPVGVLSGGEKTRVALARMLLEPHNLLLLDEPTNHLDLASKEVLLQSLLEYTGTVVIVSHDRYFLDRLATRVADVGRGEVITYPGGYEEYLSRPDPSAPPSLQAGATQHQQHQQQHQQHKNQQQQQQPQKKQQEQPQKNQQQAAGTKGEPKGAKKPQGGQKNDRAEREIVKLRERLEKRIEEMEAEVRALEERMATPGFYADPTAKDAVERHKGLLGSVKELTSEWERLA